MFINVCFFVTFSCPSVTNHAVLLSQSETCCATVQYSGMSAWQGSGQHQENAQSRCVLVCLHCRRVLSGQAAPGQPAHLLVKI